MPDKHAVPTSQCRIVYTFPHFKLQSTEKERNYGSHKLEFARGAKDQLDVMWQYLTIRQTYFLLPTANKEVTDASISLGCNLWIAFSLLLLFSVNQQESAGNDALHQAERSKVKKGATVGSHLQSCTSSYV